MRSFRGFCSRKLTRAAQVTNQIFVIDSGSTDSTLGDRNERGGEHLLRRVFLVERASSGIGRSRQWRSVHTLGSCTLDADEALTDGLIDEIRGLPVQPASRRLLDTALCKFLGRVLKHNLAPTITCVSSHLEWGFERREVRSAFCLFQGWVGKLFNSVIDDNACRLQNGLRCWHNIRRAQEVQELLAETSGAEVHIKAFGNAIERRRFLQRSVYEKFPLFSRPFFLFCSVGIILVAVGLMEKRD